MRHLKHRFCADIVKKSHFGGLLNLQITTVFNTWGQAPSAGIRNSSVSVNKSREENYCAENVISHNIHMLIGYARVSTEDLDLQRDVLKTAGCSRILEEKESRRAGTKCPALEAALDFLRTVPQLTTYKIDCLGTRCAKCSILSTGRSSTAEAPLARRANRHRDHHRVQIFNFPDTTAE